MKRFLLIVAGLIFIAIFSSSCAKWTCTCTATGYVSESTLNAALQAHKSECVTIANNGPIVDNYYNVTISCSY